MIKLKEIKYEGKTIKDNFHRMVLFDKGYRLIKYGAIVKYAENYVIDEKEVKLYSADNQFIEKVLHIVIDKVCDDDDLDTLTHIKFREDEHIPKPIMVGEPKSANHDDPKIHRVTIDEFVPKDTAPTIQFDKKVLESGLTFKEAYMRMVEGKKIARPSFVGFWYIDSFDGKIKIYDRFGNTLEKVDMTITVINTLANDWEVIE